MSAEQPERFAARSRILRDPKISNGAARLFLLLDDEARGEERIALRQGGEEGLAAVMGVSDRQIRTLIRELERGFYIRIIHHMRGNVYEFYRKKTSASERKKTSARTGRKLPAHLITQETTRTPYPLTGTEDQNQNPCECGGVGWILRPGRIIRGMAMGAERVPCSCAAADRRTA